MNNSFCSIFKFLASLFEVNRLFNLKFSCDVLSALLADKISHEIFKLNNICILLIFLIGTGRVKCLMAL